MQFLSLLIAFCLIVLFDTWVQSLYRKQCEKCPHSEYFWSVFSSNRTRKTPNMDTFKALKHSCFTHTLTKVENIRFNGLPINQIFWKMVFWYSRHSKIIDMESSDLCCNTSNCHKTCSF